MTVPDAALGRLPGHWAAAGVRRALAAPGLGEQELVSVVRAGVCRLDPVTLAGLVPTVLAHPVCTDAAVLALTGLPFPVAEAAVALSGATSGRRSWAQRCAGAVDALVAAGHPVAGALALLAHEVPDDPDDMLTATRVHPVLDRLRRAAAGHRVDVATLTRSLAGLSRGWSGTPEQLLQTALAVCAS